MPTLNFKGKTFVQNHHLAVKFHQLVPKKEKSLTDNVSLYDNLIVQGDNLKALKALLPNYAGKVKCIYIDPPYNTGNEAWAYNDNVNSPMIKDWLGKVVDKDDLTRHDKWLCMMMPRLKLLRELLSEDGVIFISIDDNELHRLKCLMDEIFSEDNYVADIVWQKSKRGDAKLIAGIHEYILVYTKNKKENLKLGNWRKFKDGVDEVLDYYSKLRKKYKEDHDKIREEMQFWYSSLPKEDEKRRHKHYSFSDERGLYFPDNFAGPDDGRKNRPRYDIIHPVTKKPCKKPSTGWRWDEERTKKALAENPPRIHFGPDESTVPCRKTYLKDVTKEPFGSVFYRDGRAASAAVKEILGSKQFDFPKSRDVLSEVFDLVLDENDIVLDSFAGSGTTAHAVLDLNKEDGGNRKFILVEMEDYANEITAERVRRVIKGVPSSKNFKEGTGGTFSYFELGDPIEMESILHGENLPSYEDFARYLFYTATGEEFNADQLDKKTNFIGSSKDYEVYLFYKPDLEYLKSTALTLERARSLGAHNGKPASRSGSEGRKRLVFAPAKFVDTHTLLELRIDFCQLPFEIYKMKG
ncbi:MAG: site-specific DNA-methyltransferase [Chitinophagales bacterium]